MAPSTISRRLLTLMLAVVLTSPIACGNKSTSSTAPPPPAVKELNSGQLGNLAMYAHAISTAGTYPYHCSIHAGMNGTVIVDASSAVSAAAVSISGFTFSPASVTIKPGGTVTWTNNDGVNHTVTSN